MNTLPTILILGGIGFARVGGTIQRFAPTSTVDVQYGDRVTLARVYDVLRRHSNGSIYVQGGCVQLVTEAKPERLLKILDIEAPRSAFNLGVGSTDRKLRASGRVGRQTARAAHAQTENCSLMFRMHDSITAEHVLNVMQKHHIWEYYQYATSHATYTPDAPADKVIEILNREAPRSQFDMRIGIQRGITRDFGKAWDSETRMQITRDERFGFEPAPIPLRDALEAAKLDYAAADYLVEYSPRACLITPWKYGVAFDVWMSAPGKATKHVTIVDGKASLEGEIHEPIRPNVATQQSRRPIPPKVPTSKAQASARDGGPAAVLYTRPPLCTIYIRPNDAITLAQVSNVLRGNHIDAISGSNGGDRTLTAFASVGELLPVLDREAPRSQFDLHVGTGREFGYAWSSETRIALSDDEMAGFEPAPIPVQQVLDAVNRLADFQGSVPNLRVEYSPRVYLITPWKYGVNFDLWISAPGRAIKHGTVIDGKVRLDGPTDVLGS